MKNKNTLTPEAIIAIAGDYENIVGKVYNALNDLRDLMGTPQYKEAANIVYTEDGAYEGAAVAVENANLSGEFSCFIQDLSEITRLWEKE
jgi:hypothetical protein